MKKTKKTGLILLMIATMLCSSLTAFAADGTASDPHVGSFDLGDEDFDGSINIHKYDINAWEKMMNDPSNVIPGHDTNYTIKYFGLQAAGTVLAETDQVGYYYLTQADEDAETNKQFVLLSALNAVSNITFRIQSAQPKDNKEGSTEVSDYDIIAVANGGIDSHGKTFEGTMSWTGVPRGYYIVSELPSETTEVPIDPFVITMPMFDPETGLDDQTEIKDIHIYPKNKAEGDPNIEKEYTSNLENGNIVSWKITTRVPLTIETSLAYSINDTLSAGLLYVEDSLVVSYTDGGGTEVFLTDAGGDFEFSKTPGADGKTIIKIDFASPAQRAALAPAAGKDLIITYDTIVNLTEEEWDALKEVSNDVTLHFENADGNEYNPKPPVVTIDDFAGILIEKTDGATEEALAGAEFRIYTRLVSGEIDETSVLKNDNNQPITLITDSDGKAYYYGLGEGTYYLVETGVPAGYKLLDGYITVIVTADDTENNNTLTYPIKNYLDNGITLPVTGGAGTLWFTIIGTGLILIGGVVFLIHRRKASDKTSA